MARSVDQPSAALIRDLKQSGLLDETIVIWAGEFGRTNYCQGKLSANSFGRDHHPRCFTIWMAGGGVKPAASRNVGAKSGRPTKSSTTRPPGACATSPTTS